MTPPSCATLERRVSSDGDDGRFDTDTHRQSVEHTLNVRAFLRWAGVNLLIGSWDNYFATPSNYFLYNSGRRGDDRGFAASPDFTFIPWDYDNSFDIDYSGTPGRTPTSSTGPAPPRTTDGGTRVGRCRGSRRSSTCSATATSSAATA
jgi:spore coat protein CotH